MKSLTNEQINKIELITSAAAKESCLALGKWTKSTISMTLEKTQLVPLQKIVESSGGPESISVALYLNIDKGISGALLFLLSEESAYHFVDLLIRKPIGTTQNLEGISRSALLETANIIACVYLNTFGKMIGTDVVPGVPHLMHDLTQSIMDSVLSEQALVQQETLYNEIRFESDGKSIDFALYFLPINESLSQML